jgi:hypothetical protein
MDHAQQFAIHLLVEQHGAQHLDAAAGGAGAGGEAAQEQQPEPAK